MTEREQLVQRRLRIVVALVFGAASLALLLSFQTIEIDYGDRFEPAWDWPRRVWLGVAVLPLAWVVRSPRRRAVFVAAGWMILGLIAGNWLFTMPLGESENPMTTRPILRLLLAGIVGLVVVGMPVLRLLTREPPGLPEARVV